MSVNGQPGAAPPDIAPADGLSGLDFLRSVMQGDGSVSGIGSLMGFRPEILEEGRVVFVGTPDSRHYNPVRVVHGGYAATLLDSAMGCAIHTTLPAGRGYTTVELKVNYLRPMTDKTGPVRAEGTIVHVGNRLATAEGRLVDESGKLYAHGSTTCMVFPM